MNITPIRTEQDYDAAMARIDELWGAPVGTPQGDELEVLATLVEVYEAKHYPIAPPHPVEAIKFRMEQQGLTPEDMVTYLGHRSRVTDILNRKRKLTLKMIRNLADGLHIPLESLISDYPLSV
ncbi:helix-turn-helix domain-containing protein [Aeromonas allosaccharophila]|uniref:helix-turn-helix domain-containing protein n=1 Tax=Aeromonas allosaccharophila TaxID=656 RepID=UPI0034466BCE